MVPTDSVRHPYRACSEIFDNGISEPAKIERAGAGGRQVTTTAEAYMLFTKGVEPMTEYEVAPGVRATKARRRAELAVRPQDFKSWQRAWEITVRGREQALGHCTKPYPPRRRRPSPRAGPRRDL